MNVFRKVVCLFQTLLVVTLAARMRTVQSKNKRKGTDDILGESSVRSRNKVNDGQYTSTEVAQESDLVMSKVCTQIWFACTSMVINGNIVINEQL